MISFAAYALLSVTLWGVLRKKSTIPLRVKLAHAGATLLLASFVIPAISHFWWGIRNPAGAIERFSYAIVLMPAWAVWLCWAFYVAVGLRFFFLCFGLAAARASARTFYQREWPILLLACAVRFPLGAMTKRQLAPEIFWLTAVAGLIYFAILLWLIERYYDTSEAQNVFGGHAIATNTVVDMKLGNLKSS